MSALTRTGRTVTLFLAATLLTACSTAAPPRPSASAVTATAPSDTASRTGGQVNLEGLLVTAEVTSTPSDVRESPAFSRLTSGLPSGTEPIAIVAKAVNSTDATIAVRTEFNLPDLRNASGTVLPALPRYVSTWNGDHVLEPHGVMTALVVYAVNPGERRLVLSWRLGDRTARLKIR